MSSVGGGRIVVDPVHGQIQLSPEEWRVVDTPSFQRLRNIKQLQFGHLVYPNATHTRFAHSLGVCHIMRRVLNSFSDPAESLTNDKKSELRLAALVHDIGHYPYSHLLEGVDGVRLTEDQVAATSASASRTVNLSSPKYPSHEEVGRLVVTGGYCQELWTGA